MTPDPFAAGAGGRTGRPHLDCHFYRPELSVSGVFKSCSYPPSMAIFLIPSVIKLNSLGFLKVVVGPSGSPGEVVKMQINLPRSPLGWSIQQTI